MSGVVVLAAVDILSDGFLDGLFDTGGGFEFDRLTEAEAAKLGCGAKGFAGGVPLISGIAVVLFGGRGGF